MLSIATELMMMVMMAKIIGVVNIMMKVNEWSSFVICYLVYRRYHSDVSDVALIFHGRVRANFFKIAKIAK